MIRRDCKWDLPQNVVQSYLDWVETLNANDPNAAALSRLLHKKGLAAFYVSMNLPYWHRPIFGNLPEARFLEASFVCYLMSIWYLAHDSLYDGPNDSHNRSLQRSIFRFSNSFYSRCSSLVGRDPQFWVDWSEVIDRTAFAMQLNNLQQVSSKEYLRVAADRAAVIRLGPLILRSICGDGEFFAPLVDAIEILLPSLQAYDDLLDFEEDTRVGQSNLFLCDDTKDLSINDRVEFVVVMGQNSTRSASERLKGCTAVSPRVPNFLAQLNDAYGELRRAI